MSERSTVTREQLEKAAQLRAQGATWNVIREATGTKLGSSQWFKYWTDNDIPHRKAGEPKPKVEPVAAGPAETTPSKPEPRTRRPRTKVATKDASVAEKRTPAKSKTTKA